MAAKNQSQTEGSGGEGNGGAVSEGGAPAALISQVRQTMQGAVSSLQNEHRRLIDERTVIDQQLSQINETLSGMGITIDQPTPQRSAPRRRGRPRGSRNQTTAKRGPGRPRGSRNQTTAKRGPGRPRGTTRSDNSQTLTSALSNLLTQNGAMSIPDIITGVQAPPINYKSGADGFRSIVQQSFTNHLASFGRDGKVKTGSDGNPVGRGGRPAMFVRVGRGMYDILRKGDTAESVEKRGSKLAAAASE